MSPTDLPPGPRRPALAQTLQWVFDPERFMRTCRERYGSTFTARLGPSADVVFLCEPEDVKTVFQGTPEETNMGDINGLFRRVLGTNSLLVIDGDEHLRQRRLLLPPFHGERIAEHYGAMVEAAEEDVAGWQEGQTLTLQPHMQAMTLNVILAAVFGLGPGRAARPLPRAAGAPAGAEHHAGHHVAPAADRAGRPLTVGQADALHGRGRRAALRRDHAPARAERPHLG